MKWRARIHYLLRFAKLAQSNESRQKICKLIATYTTSIESKTLDEKIEAFKNEAKSAATQMQVDDVIDIDNVIPFNPEDKNIDNLNKLFDDIVHDQFERSIEMPLSFVFLRSFLCRKDESKLFISKTNLKQIAAKLRIANEMFEKFCQLFTSFGSIIDVSLIDSSSDLIILKPVDFLHELDKLFYPSSDVDPLVKKCGIITESTAAAIFGDNVNIFMSFLMSFGLAQKLPSRQFSISVTGKYAYYVPHACIGSPIVESDPTALHLLRDINMPMSHIRVNFTSAFLKKPSFNKGTNS